MRYFALTLVCLLWGCGPSSEPPPGSAPDTAIEDAPDSDVGAEHVVPDVAQDLDAGDVSEPDSDVTPDADVAIDAADASVDTDDGGAADLPDAPEPNGPHMRPPDGHPTELFVGGHADDDLLFMNPDILAAIAAGHAVRTIIITGGDACGTREPADREAGLRAAYGKMATGSVHTEDDWTCDSSPTGEYRWGPLVDSVQAEFSDELGWSSTRYGATIRYGDIDGDGLDDVCGRGNLGLFCALGIEEGFFDKPTFWSFRTQLSDDEGWPTEERYTGAFQLIDINDDGRADACLRSPDGLICGWSTGSTFDAMLPLHVFSDEDGFADTNHGSAVVWDVESRRVCARRAEGLVCAEL